MSNPQNSGGNGSPTSSKDSHLTKTSNTPPNHLFPTTSLSFPEKTHQPKVASNPPFDMMASPSSTNPNQDPTSSNKAFGEQPPPPTSSSGPEHSNKFNPLNYFRDSRRGSYCEACAADKITCFADVQEAFSLVSFWSSQIPVLSTCHPFGSKNSPQIRTPKIGDPTKFELPIHSLKES